MPLLTDQLDAVATAMPLGVSGRVQAVSGMTIEASDLPLPLGSLCRIERFGDRPGRPTCSAEVIGFQSDRTLLMPLSDTDGVARGDRVGNLASSPRVWCGEQLLGRVLDGFGRPIDGGPPPRCSQARRIDGRVVAPLDRAVIRQPIATSVRCIDALHTCGRGQRMGLFAGPGVGKSTLMAQIAANTDADVSVVALIGERGREVQEFLEHALTAEQRKRVVVIVSTGDDPPLLKVRAAKLACTVSEFFRDLGRDVLLLMDSLTRLAQAQRQIGLAAKEPPATKGFPPSVFALLPKILERAGKTPVGSITGFYTVLVEGDDFNEPIPDAVKGITDGHLWLSRDLAERGHFPAIDPLRSISRVRGDVTERPQSDAAKKVLSLVAAYRDIEDLVNIGAFVQGANPRNDLAVQWRDRINSFLQQSPAEPQTMEQSKRALMTLAAQIGSAEGKK